MTLFDRHDLEDIVVAIDVTTGTYNQELEAAVKNLYRDDSNGYHRLRSIVHRLKTALGEDDESA